VGAIYLVIGFAAGGGVVALAWVVSHSRLADGLSRSQVNLNGQWHGWSVYVPVDGFFFGDQEAIYRTEAEFFQKGRRLRVSEKIHQIYDIHGRPLDHLPPRRFTGRGSVGKQGELVLWFHEQGGVANGAMLCHVHDGGNAIYAVLCVRPRLNGRPVAVKLQLRRASQPMPDLDTLGIDGLRRLAGPAR